MPRFWDTYFPPLLRPLPEGETHVDLTDAIGSYRKDIKDYVAISGNIHVIYWDQMLTALQSIRQASKSDLNDTNLIDYLNDKLL